MAAISKVGSTLIWGGSTNVGARTVGDLLVLQIGRRSSNHNEIFPGTITIGAGWTQHPSGTAHDSAGAGDGMVTLWKVADGTEGTIDVSSFTTGYLTQWHNDDGGGWELDASAEVENASNNPVHSGSVTPTAGIDCLIIGGAVIRVSDGSAKNTTPDAGWTEIADSMVGSAVEHPEFWSAYQIVEGASGSYEPSGTCNQSGRALAGQTMVFRATDAPLPDPQDAIEFDVYKINPPGASMEYLATLFEATDKRVRVERNAPGSGYFRISRHATEATSEVLARGNLVKVRVPVISADHIFAFWMEEGDFSLVSSNEEGGETLEFGGKGALAYWDRAIWLAESFSVPWWPACADPPAAGATGVVDVASGPAQSGDGVYRLYTVNASDEITGFTTFTTAGFCASFNRRRTYVWPGANPDGSDSQRFLVQLLDGPHAGGYFAPHQAGVTEYLRKVTIGTTIDLANVGDGDKPGQVIDYMASEAQSASRTAQPLALMTRDFDDTNDTDGNAWTTTDALAGVTVQINDTYLSTLGKLLGLGVVDVWMGPDLDMHAYNGLGRDLAGDNFGVGVVRFEKGVNIADELVRAVRQAPEATFAQVIGTEDAYAQVELADADSRVHREVGTTGASTEEAALEAIGTAHLDRLLERVSSAEFAIATGDDEAAGLYMPGPEGTNGHFWLGDTVRVHTGTGVQDYDEENIVVVAITITRSQAADNTDAGELVVSVEVGARASEGGSPGGSYGGGLASPSGAAPTTVFDGSGYQRTSEKSVAGGYASLDDDAKLPIAELPDHATRHEDGGDDAMEVDAAPGTGSLRTLGTGAAQAAAGDHSHGSLDPDTVRDAGRWELLMEDGVTAPPVPLENEVQDDWLYGWLEG